MASTAVTASPLESRASSLAFLLRLDALTGVATGIALAAAHVPLAPLLGVPPWLLLGAGLGVLPFTLVMWLASHDPMGRPALVWTVIAGNVAWVVLSLLVAFVWFTPTTLGLAVLLVQALAVELLAWLEYRAWVRTRARAASA